MFGGYNGKHGFMNNVYVIYLEHMVCQLMNLHLTYWLQISDRHARVWVALVIVGS